MTKAELFERDKKAVVTETQAKILIWYLDRSGGVLPAQQCENTRPYRNFKSWHLEPVIPGEDNPVLIQEEWGGQWTCRIQYVNPLSL